MDTILWFTYTIKCLLTAYDNIDENKNYDFQVIYRLYMWPHHMLFLHLNKTS